MLENHIRASGLSREAWAARLSISESFLSQLCTGRKRPSLAVAIAIWRETGGAVPVESWIEAQGAADDRSSGEAA